MRSCFAPLGQPVIEPGAKDNYLNAYKSYLVSLGDSVSCKRLVRASEQYWHVASAWRDDIMEIWQTCAAEVDTVHCRKMISNGSSKIANTEYWWGPNFPVWEAVIWRFMHRQWPATKNRLYLRPRSMECALQDAIQCFGQVLHMSQQTGELAWTDIGKVDYRVRYLFEEQLHGITMIGAPLTVHAFLQKKWFQEFAQERIRLFSLTETDPDPVMPFVSSFGIPAVNQMRSWMEGTAFHTCPFGTKHFLDFLFVVDGSSVIDLLNMAPRVVHGNPDNIVEEGPLTECQCGALYRPYRFTPCALKSMVDCRGRLVDPTASTCEMSDTARSFEWLQIVQQPIASVFMFHANREPTATELKRINAFCTRVFQARATIKTSIEPFLVGSREKRPVLWSLTRQ